MARNKGTFPFAANFEVKAASPLDPRVLVEKKSELISKDTWPLDGDTLYIYKGLLVSVQEERAIYMLVDPDKILESDYSGWERKDGSQGGEGGYDNMYVIPDLTIEQILNTDEIIECNVSDITSAIDANKQIYIRFVDYAQGLTPCNVYRDDFHYISFVWDEMLCRLEIAPGNNYVGILKKINLNPVASQSDWSTSDESDPAYIKNRTHYEVEHEITNGFTLVGFLYNKCKYDEDTDGYYTTSDIKIRYNEDDYEGTIIIQKGTLLGHGNFNDEVTITGDDQGEEFEFTSYVEDYNIYFKVSQPNSGTNFRLLEYVTLDDAYIPDTIARKSDLENIGGGGSVDSEEITEIKTTLDSHNELIEDLQNMKIDKENDDYYPNMSVGVADNLSGVDVVASEFTTRQSGGGAISDGVARIESIKGNSIVWNQLVKAPVFDPNASNGWTVNNYNAGVGLSVENNEIRLDFRAGFASGGSFYVSPRVPLKKGHKYLYSFFIKKNTTANCGAYLGNVWNNFGSVVADTWYKFDYIASPTDDLTRGLWLYPLNGQGGVATEYDITVWLKNVVVYDLTQMFGAGNEPTTVEDFNKRIPVGVDSMLYNEGQMINLNPSGIESYSADEEPIKRFQDLSLIAASFPDGMKSVGEFHDEIRYNKETQKWEKITRIGEVDLGSLNWSYASDVGYFYSSSSKDIGDGNTFKETDKQVVLINSADFTGLHWSAFTNNYVTPRNNAISLFYTIDWDAVRANILCNEYTDAASFKEYLQGKKAYFVLNDPIVEELEFDGNLDYQVWNGGTEELVADNPSSALKADIVYGFNAVGKIKELENKIDNLGTGGGGNGGSSITVDSVLSDTSTNPVQNKVIYEALSTKLESEVVASSSPTEEIPFGYDDTEIWAKVDELSAEVGKKVDANFVNNAIAEAIGEAIDGGY